MQFLVTWAQTIQSICVLKINSLQIQDRDDSRELNKLRKSRHELLLELNKKSGLAAAFFLYLIFSEEIYL